MVGRVVWGAPPFLTRVADPARDRAPLIPERACHTPGMQLSGEIGGIGLRSAFTRGYCRCPGVGVRRLGTARIRFGLWVLRERNADEPRVFGPTKLTKVAFAG